jgi:hypothetical protein
MRIIERAGIAAISSIMLIGSAAAADLTGPELKNSPLRKIDVSGNDGHIEGRRRPGRDLLRR